MNPETLDAAARVLDRGLSELQMQFDAERERLLLDYIELLYRWNRAYNLTAVTDPVDMVSRHLLDSLAVLPFLRGQRFIDLGTGAGLPGIPLAIAVPDKSFVLLDSNGKKIRFLFQARISLGLANVEEVQARVENYRPAAGFDGILSRAFASLEDMIKGSRHLLNPGGRFYAMKGRYPDRELSRLTKPYNVCGSHPLRIPGLEEDRYLIEIGTTP